MWIYSHRYLTVAMKLPLYFFRALITLIPFPEGKLESPGGLFSLHAVHCAYAPSQDFTVPFHFELRALHVQFLSLSHAGRAAYFP